MLLNILAITFLYISCAYGERKQETLPSYLKTGDDFFNYAEDLIVTDKNYKLQAEAYLIALSHAEQGTNKDYDMDEARDRFYMVFHQRGHFEDAHIFLANEYFSRADFKTGMSQCELAIQRNPKCVEAYHLMVRAMGIYDKSLSTQESAMKRMNELKKVLQIEPHNGETYHLMGNIAFEIKDWPNSLHYLEQAVLYDKTQLSASASAVYLRQLLCKWGNNGSQYDADMKLVEKLIKNEKRNGVRRNEGSVVHPHMALSYTIDPLVKLSMAKVTASGELHRELKKGLQVIDHTPLFQEYVDMSVTSILHISKDNRTDSSSSSSGTIESSVMDHKGDTAIMPTSKTLSTSSMPRSTNLKRDFSGGRMLLEITHLDDSVTDVVVNADFRIKIAYCSGSISSKALTYLTQDLMEFHNTDRFEVHVYATNPADPVQFIESNMEGVDYRAKIKNQVEFFHDVSGMKTNDIVQMIHEAGIHILINWDGYSHTGSRRDGLFAAQPAPLCISHMEYMGTMGADYVQYLVTDQVAVPLDHENYYLEKFLVMPHSFMATSFHLLSPEIQPPKWEIPTAPRQRPCGVEMSEGQEEPSFVYCNFNKHLKYDPYVARSWLETLQKVEGSILCLLEYPKESTTYLTPFIREFDPTLLERVRYMPWDHSVGPSHTKRRVEDTCNAFLDTFEYGSHAMAAEALWAGVPLVTFGYSKVMSGRVGASALTTLGLTDFIASDIEDYGRISVLIGRNSSTYTNVRNRLVGTAYSEPINAFWDTERYVENFEKGLEMMWYNYLSGNQPRHMKVEDSDAVVLDSTAL